jgi:hypothetical protein
MHPKLSQELIWLISISLLTYYDHTPWHQTSISHTHTHTHTHTRICYSSYIYYKCFKLLRHNSQHTSWIVIANTIKYDIRISNLLSISIWVNTSHNVNVWVTDVLQGQCCHCILISLRKLLLRSHFQVSREVTEIFFRSTRQRVSIRNKLFTTEE